MNQHTWGFQLASANSPYSEVAHIFFTVICKTNGMTCGTFYREHNSTVSIFLCHMSSGVLSPHLIFHVFDNVLFTVKLNEAPGVKSPDWLGADAICSSGSNLKIQDCLSERFG